MFAEKLPRRPMRGLVAVKRDGARQSALALERPTEKHFGRRDIPLCAEKHDGTKIAAHAGRGSFRHEEQIQKHLEAARNRVAAMGDPRRDMETPREAAARDCARRERIERLEHAVAEVKQIWVAKRPGYARTNQQQTGVSSTDPEARIMRHADGHCALSYNVQISTDADNGIAVSVSVGQAAPDYDYLAPAVEQIKTRLGRAPEQIVVDAGYMSRQNILAAHDQNIELVGPWIENDGRVRQRFARAGVSDSFLPDKFNYDAASDAYICPRGKHLVACKGRIMRPGRTIVRYQASRKDCTPCPNRGQCCMGATGTKTSRPEWSPYAPGLDAMKENAPAKNGFSSFPHPNTPRPIR